ncbi:hypothetical protein M514_20885 [Trichuris suis]|uniref:Uncharacterized protein n=1 Tax=Trichuris suis TaxID=68888 RepID=A0A085NC23_9BILA|nr:hypothetical protein M514_20885 [Trichuris suis]
MVRPGGGTVVRSTRLPPWRMIAALPVPEIQLLRGFSLDDARRGCAHIKAKPHYVSVEPTCRSPHHACRVNKGISSSGYKESAITKQERSHIRVKNEEIVRERA